MSGWPRGGLCAGDGSKTHLERPDIHRAGRLRDEVKGVPATARGRARQLLERRIYKPHPRASGAAHRAQKLRFWTAVCSQKNLSPENYVTPTEGSQLRASAGAVHLVMRRAGPGPRPTTVILGCSTPFAAAKMRSDPLRARARTGTARDADRASYRLPACVVLRRIVCICLCSGVANSAPTAAATDQPSSPPLWPVEFCFLRVRAAAAPVRWKKCCVPSTRNERLRHPPSSALCEVGDRQRGAGA